MDLASKLTPSVLGRAGRGTESQKNRGRAAPRKTDRPGIRPHACLAPSEAHRVRRARRRLAEPVHRGDAGGRGAVVVVRLTAAGANKTSRL